MIQSKKERSLLPKERSLLPYDKDRPCPKCGEKGAGVKYVAEGGAHSGKVVYDRTGFMQRKCVLCGYVWKEEPLDKGEGK